MSLMWTVLLELCEQQRLGSACSSGSYVNEEGYDEINSMWKVKRQAKEPRIPPQNQKGKNYTHHKMATVHRRQHAKPNTQLLPDRWSLNFLKLNTHTHTHKSERTDTDKDNRH